MMISRTANDTSVLLQTLDALIHLNMLPIVNENDTVSTEEIRLEDNDRLSALVAAIIQSDGLFILTLLKPCSSGSDGPRRCDSNPGRGEVSQEMIDRTEPSRTTWGTGGMVTKLDAARAATRGEFQHFWPGGVKNVLVRLVDGESIGTEFHAGSRELQGRKHWIGYSLTLWALSWWIQEPNALLWTMEKVFFPPESFP